MNYISHLNNFFGLIQHDKKLTPAHISLYMALFQYWNYNRFQNPFPIYRDSVLRLSKIGSKNTYHKCLKELHQAKYIIYHPATGKYQPIEISVINLDEIEKENPNQLMLFNVKKSTVTSPIIDTSVSTNNGTYTSPGNDTTQVPFLTDTSTDSGTQQVPKMGHYIKHINNKQRDSLSPKKNGENREIREAVNELAHVPFLGHVNDPPKLEEVQNFFLENSYPQLEAKKFYNHYKALGWKLSGNQVEDWRALANKWMLNDRNFNNTKNTKKNATIQQRNPKDNPDYSQPL